MPIDLQINHDTRRVTETFTGDVTPQELRQAQAAIADGDAWQYATLALCEALTSLPTTPNVRTTVAFVSRIGAERGARGPLAIVTGANDAFFGMARMYATLSDEAQGPIRIFRTRPEAEAWLAAGAPDPADPTTPDR